VTCTTSSMRIAGRRDPDLRKPNLATQGACVQSERNLYSAVEVGRPTFTVPISHPRFRQIRTAAHRRGHGGAVGRTNPRAAPAAGAHSARAEPAERLLGVLSFPGGAGIVVVVYLLPPRDRRRPGRGPVLLFPAPVHTNYVTRTIDRESFQAARIIYHVRESEGVLSARTLEPLLVTIPPRHRASEPFAHPGEEFAYVLKGALTLWIDGKRHTLRPGDGIHFSARTRHSFENSGHRPVVAVWVTRPKLF
jgi:quercetin dioxygenase-like cupin family protein